MDEEPKYITASELQERLDNAPYRVEIPGLRIVANRLIKIIEEKYNEN